MGDNYCVKFIFLRFAGMKCAFSLEWGILAVLTASKRNPRQNRNYYPAAREADVRQLKFICLGCKMMRACGASCWLLLTQPLGIFLAWRARGWRGLNGPRYLRKGRRNRWLWILFCFIVVLLLQHFSWRYLLQLFGSRGILVGWRSFGAGSPFDRVCPKNWPPPKPIPNYFFIQYPVIF